MHAQTESWLQYREYGLASLVLPGFGHLLQGLPFRALLWFGGAVILWGTVLAMFASGAPPSEPLWLVIAPVLAGYHCASMYSAVRARQHRGGDPIARQAPLQTLPAFLWKQAIGGTLAVAGVVVLVLWSGNLANTFWRWWQQGWGWHNQHWGDLMSQMLLLWAMVAAGGWLFWQGYKQQKEDEPRLREQALIAQALRNDGVITPAVASLVLDLSLREAHAYLDRLAQEGLAQREERDGLVSYRLIASRH